MYAVDPVISAIFIFYLKSFALVTLKVPIRGKWNELAMANRGR